MGMSDYRYAIAFVALALATLAFGIYQDTAVTRRKPLAPDVAGMKPKDAPTENRGQIGNVPWSFGSVRVRPTEADNE